MYGIDNISKDQNYRHDKMGSYKDRVWVKIDYLLKHVRLNQPSALFTALPHMTSSNSIDSIINIIIYYYDLYDIAI